MAYTRQTWADGSGGTPVSAARLNYMEEGIERANGTVRAADFPSLADAFAAAGGRAVLLSGAYTLTGALTISAPVVCDGPVSFTASSVPATGAPTTVVTVTAPTTLDRVTFTGVRVAVTADRVRVSGGRFLGSSLEFGTDSAPVRDVIVEHCEFIEGDARDYTALTLRNAANVVVRHNRFQEHALGLYVGGTISYAARDITVDDNTFANCVTGMQAYGSGLSKLTGLRILSNTIAGSSRGSVVSAESGIDIRLAAQVTIADNVVATFGNALHAEALTQSTIRANRFEGGRGSNKVRLFGCAGVQFLENRSQANGTGVYALLVSDRVNGYLGNNNPYPSANHVIAGNDLRGGNRAVRVDLSSNVRVLNNTISGTDALDAATGLLYVSGSGTSVTYIGNKLTAPSGSPVVVGSGATTSTAEAQTLTTATLTKSVTAPVITTADAALNGAKSYVVTFTVSDVRMFRHLVDNANPKTLSQWMTGITGATLAWNWSAWTASTGDLLPDLIVDGSVYDNVGLEESYDLARSCAAVLDLNNRLLTRDFHLLQPTTQPRGIAAAKVAEGAWQSANFRPPLVVDGAAYDPVPSGLLNTAGWTSTLGGRMSLGQRSDGTYVLVAVDGVSGSSGCTMQQLAAKHVALGSVVAHNLDGGGSVTLWYNGAVINSPSDAGGQRLIPSALYI